jgi:hypothetical protein
MWKSVGYILLCAVAIYGGLWLPSYTGPNPFRRRS